MTQRISFSLVVALLLGWVAMGLLIVRSSNTLLDAQTLDADRPITQPHGVKVKIDVDKKVYGANDIVLLSLRNDSSKDIWLSERADGCSGTWWAIDVLRNGDQWVAVPLSKTKCTATDYGVKQFSRHSIQTDEWNILVPSDQLGDVFSHAPTGTYRLRVPYLIGQQATEADWATMTKYVVSPSFTVQ